MAGKKGLDLVCLVDPRCPASVVGNVTRLQQIILNLLSNSTKFTAKGKVVLTVTAQPLSIVLPPSDGPFYQQFLASSFHAAGSPILPASTIASKVTADLNGSSPVTPVTSLAMSHQSGRDSISGFSPAISGHALGVGGTHTRPALAARTPVADAAVPALPPLPPLAESSPSQDSRIKPIDLAAPAQRNRDDAIQAVLRDP